MAWGLWRTPESRSRFLGPIRGQRILELGCGAARWSSALQRRGAWAVGVDLSREQLRLASRGRPPPGTAPRLIEGTATCLPFRSATFDSVFSDWGAMTFADPKLAVPECARVLRPGGRLVFATASPIGLLTLDRRLERHSRRVQRSYFELRRIVPGPTEPIEYPLPYGEWVALFTEHGLSIEGLVETRPGVGARTSYLSRADTAFGRRWPLECIWRLRKSPSPSSPA